MKTAYYISWSMNVVNILIIIWPLLRNAGFPIVYTSSNYIMGRLNIGIYFWRLDLVSWGIGAVKMTVNMVIFCTVKLFTYTIIYALVLW